MSILLEKPIVWPCQCEDHWYIVECVLLQVKLKTIEIDCIYVCWRYLQCI